MFEFIFIRKFYRSKIGKSFQLVYTTLNWDKSSIAEPFNYEL